jgi:hypothetical protein
MLLVQLLSHIVHCAAAAVLLCRCHCTELDPDAVIDKVFKRYGKPSPNREWRMNHQPPATPGPVNCKAKTAFDIKGIYGDVAQVSPNTTRFALRSLLDCARKR